MCEQTAHFVVQDEFGIAIADAVGERAEAWAGIQRYAHIAPENGPVDILEVIARPIMRVPKASA